MNRRTFLTAAAAGAVVNAVNAVPAWAASHGIKAIGFDGLALFDPRPIFALAEQFFPGQGAALVATWRGRQFDYTWLRTMTGTYVDFIQVTGDALAFAADAEKLTVTPEQRQQLLAGFMNMKAWPDVVPVLKTLKKRGLGLAPLTDFSVPMLEAAIRNSQLEGVFDHLLSTDLVRAYKPDPRSYQMGVDAFGLQREEIAFVAFGGWDAAGAKTFGYPTIWMNRLNVPTEHLGVLPDAIAANFEALPGFVGQ
ncbi:haloacid dehalogenase type II [Paraburkholderia sp. DHOC27]|uniref:haloacid dehalogenase type II n=1 Tax=Paraburkholderia sp. DHOC27 TaxID=2303330 RepID=UPI001C708877|nr:haloacid dehalogenase type II [Paraburkholderia sp. DHOC27]